MNLTQRNSILLAACLAIPLLAGCTGYGPDTVRKDDEVQLRMDIYDLSTGALLAHLDSVNLTVGASHLGADLDRALVGRRIGDRVEVESRGDAGRNFTSLVVRPQLLSSRDVSHTVPRLGAWVNITLGEVVQFQDGFNGRVTALNETNVTYELLMPSDPVVDYPELGLRLILRRDAGHIDSIVEPLPPAPIFTGPLGNFLPDPGEYQVLGTSGGNITFLHWAAGAPSTGQGLRFEVTVLEVEQARRTVSSRTGGYGARDSPHVAPGTGFPEGVIVD